MYVPSISIFVFFQKLKQKQKLKTKIIFKEVVRVLFKYNCLFKLLKTVLLFEFKKEAVI